MQQRPKFAQMILHGRAGETEAMSRAQFAHDLAGLGLGIFDHLRFIEDQ